MLPLSLALAERCDACLRIGGPSAGADAEVATFAAAARRCSPRSGDPPARADVSPGDLDELLPRAPVEERQRGALAAPCAVTLYIRAVSRQRLMSLVPNCRERIAKVSAAATR
jgi:hypothetical protein